MDEPKSDLDEQQWIEAEREHRKRYFLQQEEQAEKELAKRRAIWSLSPLPRRAVPRLWEDLASVLVRTAQLMGYPQPSWILHPERAGHSISKDALPLLAKQLDYDLLSRLLNLDEVMLYNMTLHRFAERTTDANGATRADSATKQGIPYLTKLPRLWNAQQLFTFAGPNIQICPLCLGEPGGGYDRLYWRATPVLICSRHRVWLIDACPTCHKPILALRPKLITCPTCSGDYLQGVLPLAPQDGWLYSTHRVFLAQLDISATELGDPLAEDEHSPLQDLASHEYLWIVSQFLEILTSRPYYERLLPFLLHTLPVEDLVRSPAQGLLLLLHYLLACWPLHFWILLERLQLALEGDDLWFHIAYIPAKEWKAQIARGDIWHQSIPNEKMMVFLHMFFKTMKDYFQQHRQPRLRSAPFGKRIVPVEPLVAKPLRPPGPSEWVSPRPWEDVASVISRVARNMGFAQADWVLISTEAPYHKVYSLDIPLLHRLADYQMLERQLGLDERSLYHLTMNRFASCLQPPQKGEQAVTPSAEAEAIGYPLLSHSAVRRVGISLRDIKLCPNCLEEEESYDRLF